MPNTRNQWVAYLRYAKGARCDIRMWVDISFRFSHPLKRRKYQHSAYQNPIRTKQLVSRKKQWAFRGAERGQTRLLNFSASTSGNIKTKSVCWRGTYGMFRWKQFMYSRSHANKNKLVTFLIPERGQTRLLNFSASTSGNKKRKSVCWRGTYFLFRWKQSMNSKSYANKYKLVTFLIPEHRRGRVAYQRHEMSSERSQKVINIGTYTL